VSTTRGRNEDQDQEEGPGVGGSYSLNCPEIPIFVSLACHLFFQTPPIHLIYVLNLRFRRKYSPLANSDESQSFERSDEHLLRKYRSPVGLVAEVERWGFLVIVLWEN
jgi:hypothetical protein